MREPLPAPPPADPEAIARRFRALSDPLRLRVLELLAGGERCVCELTAALESAQPLLSFHLKTLRDAGLVTGRRQGRWSYYALVPVALSELGRFLDALPVSGAAPPCVGCGDDISRAGRRRPALTVVEDR